jgi:hypothetical protein
MRTRGFWLLLMAALLGLEFPAASLAGPGDLPPPGSNSVFSQMLGRPPKRPPPPATPEGRAPKPGDDPTARARNRELENWLRRTDVCVKLMQVADETNDEALRKKAEDLERRARQTYERRIAELNGEASDEHLLKKPNESHSAGIFSLFHGNDKAAAPAKEGGSQ